MKQYYQYQILNRITIQQLVTLEHLDFEAGYSYPEEVHDFYEFVYIKKGSVTCNMQNKAIKLVANDFLLIPPHKKHSYNKEDEATATVLIVCFSSSNSIIKNFSGQIKLNKAERALMQKIILEATNAFQFPFAKRIVPLSKPVFGAQQLVKNYIEELLILLIRNNNKSNNVQLFSSKESLFEQLSKNIITYLNENIYSALTLESICAHFHFSKNYLNNIFKSFTNSSIMQYYNALKINEAKRLLRENVSISGVAHMLKMDSPNYFIKFFKRYTGLTPSQYRSNKNNAIL